MKISSSITIQASPATIWSVLLDFNQYQHWNPFILKIKGNTEVGQQLQITIGKMNFSPMVQTNIAYQHFSWLGKLWFSGIFDGLHVFEIKQTDSNSCTFIQSETFKGVLVPFLKNKLQTDTLQGFHAMNRALKTRAEYLQKELDLHA